MADSNAALKYVRDNHDALVDTLKTLVAIPSISTLPEHKPDLQRAAEFLATEMKATGLENVRIMPTEGHPIVYGDWLNAPGKPTVLIYGHYDVQPADMADGWHSDPFTPIVQDDTLYGRGASDMKGQVIAVLSALRALHQHNGSLPINFKLLLEGEEEIGSPNLPKFLTDNRALLAADFSLNPDAGMLHATQPAITYSLRGLAYFELRVYGPQQDLHSGLFGGAVHNPANVLAKLIAGLHDDNGRIMLPRFYDSVRDLDAEERAALAQLPYNDDDIRKAAANPPRLYGEHNYTAIERIGARPSLDVNGLYSGFTGEGSKTVLPARAMAKISTRLVADQDPIQVEKQLRDYLTANAPDSVTWELTLLAHCPTAITDRNSPWVRAMQRALESGFGVPPVFRREGGSVPIVGHMQQLLGIETVLTGFSTPDDGIHGPNEKMRLPNYFKGIESLIHFFVNLAQ